MLAEAFLAASSSPPTLTSSQSTLLKDAGLFKHDFQPQTSLRQTFKKSVTAANCIALNDSHVFAAQSEKATVHVYNYEKCNQEATISFPQRIRSLSLTSEGTVLILGTEDGGLILWEIYTGRQISTARSHLHAVTALAHDMKGNIVLSGSGDSTIHVWSMLDLLSFPSTTSIVQSEPKTPERSLSGHRGPITSLVMGHSTTSIDIAISASRDDTAIVWSYHLGIRLRIILLPSTPLCLALDPADRGLYVGLEDGSVQLVDFVNLGYSATAHAQDPSPTSTPIQPSPSDRMYVSTVSKPSSGSTLSICLSYDSMSLVTGHANGKIISWDIGRRSLNHTVVDYPGAPITNLQFLPPQGFPTTSSRQFRQSAIVKPRPHEAFSGSQGGELTGSYCLSAQLIAAPSIALVNEKHQASTFARSFGTSTFSDDVLIPSIRDILGTEFHRGNTAQANGVEFSGTIDGTTDFVSLTASTSDAMREELQYLRDQLSHLRKMQVASNKHVDQLVKEQEHLKRQAGNSSKISNPKDT